MKLFDSLFCPQPMMASTSDALDDRFYGRGGTITGTGLRITPEIALKASAVLACVKLLSETMGTMPALIIETNGRERSPARSHPLWPVIHDQPNSWMTPYQFWSLAVVFTALWGNFYARIVPGPRGFASALLPLHSDKVRVKQQDDLSLIYEITNKTGPKTILLQHEVFHLRGMSIDSEVGLDVMNLAREVVSLALAAEGYAARLFSNDARPGGVIQHSGILKKEGRDNLKDSWRNAYAGVGNAHNVAVLEEGMEFKPITPAAKDTQMVETRKEQAIEIARIFSVPPPLIGILDDANYSNVVALAEFFGKFTMTAWAVNYGQSINTQLLQDPGRFSAKFLMLALLRGDPKTRGEFYKTLFNISSITPNEVRGFEDLNPLPGGDELFVPLNLREGSAVPQGASAQAESIIRAAAHRIARKEFSIAAKAAERHPNDNDAYQAAVDSGFTGHAAFISVVLLIPADEAADIAADAHAAALDGLASMGDWCAVRMDQLTRLALNTKEDAG